MTLKEMRREIKIEIRSMQKQAKNTKCGEYIEKTTVMYFVISDLFQDNR